jgi:H+/Cl- antiporter ClcA
VGVTILIMVVLLATVGVVVATVHSPATAVLIILALTGAELAVFIPFTYRRAKRTREW